MADLPGTPKPVACEFCGAPRHTKGFPFGDRIWWAPYGPERCTCPDAVAAFEKAEAERKAKEEAERKAEEDRKLRDKIQRIVGESGMGDRFLRRTFSTFQITDSNQKAAASPSATRTASTGCCQFKGSQNPAATAYSSPARRAPAKPTSPQP